MLRRAHAHRAQEVEWGPRVGLRGGRVWEMPRDVSRICDIIAHELARLHVSYHSDDAKRTLVCIITRARVGVLRVHLFTSVSEYNRALPVRPLSAALLLLVNPPRDDSVKVPFFRWNRSSSGDWTGLLELVVRWSPTHTGGLPLGGRG